MKNKLLKRRLVALMMALSMTNVVSCKEQSSTAFDTKNGKKDLKDYDEFLKYYNIDYNNCTATAEDDIVYIKERKIVKHTAQPGETVKTIIEEYDMTSEEFEELNMIDENYKLIEGKEYRIYKNKTYSFKLEQLEDNGKYLYCTIVEGNTLWGIAQDNDITVEELLEINSNITDPNNIPIGTTIKIPRKEKTLKK